MKIYTYFVCKIWCEDTKDYKIQKLKTINEVIEYPGTYEQADDKRFYTNWSSVDGKWYLCKDYIEKVQRHIFGTTAIYAVYLTDDNEEKAYNMIADECKKDIDELYKKLDEQKDILNTILSGSVRMVLK